MMFTEKYKSMNEQISPSEELVDKVKKSRQVWKPVLQFALPALMILAVFCFQILGPALWGNTDLNGGNRFSIVAYASEDTTFEITKDMKVLLPAGAWNIRRQDGGLGVGWSAKTTETGEIIPGGFTIIGENMKSVKLESKNGAFRDSLMIRNDYSNENNDYILNPVYLEGGDIANARYFAWWPSNLSGNNKIYFTDTITITVRFNDGGVVTQTVGITIDENTGEMFAQIIG